MQNKSEAPPKSKPKLKLVGKAPPKLHLGAAAQSDDIAPGEYLVRCTDAWVELYGVVWRAVWQFQILDGPHHGVGLRKWKMFDQSGEVPLTGEFARACEIALGRPLAERDDLANPAAIFAGKTFVVFAGYRKTEKPKGGRPSDELALKKKDPSDKLKVHEIRSLVKL